FFGLAVDSELSPETILFYADGVKLACEGSAVVESLRALVKGVSRGLAVDGVSPTPRLTPLPGAHHAVA
ncbi:MAG: hypothetical protein WBM29_01840, partial [Candidatus Deferrimicrobium sp.]